MLLENFILDSIIRITYSNLLILRCYKYSEIITIITKE